MKKTALFIICIIILVLAVGCGETERVESQVGYVSNAQNVVDGVNNAISSYPTELE